ncbi:MAG: hypothetical protein PHX74_02885 [Candidatus Sumerlaeales bacterium]|nr:hypothetical protein [Candidatus Sumerlaeales bacterium]
MSRWLSAGIVPFWDPHVFGGCPVLEMQQRGIWYPVSFLSILLFPPRLSLLFEMTAHIGLGLLVSWFALRKGFGLSFAAATIGASCYMFGSSMVGRVIASHYTVVAGSSWMLLVLGATYRSMSADVRCAWRWVAIASCVCAAMVYAGAPQYVIYVGWSQIAFLIGAFGFRQWKRSALIFACMWTCAALLSAPQWLPTMAYLPWSARASGDLMKSVPYIEYVTSLLEFLTPLPFGDEVRSAHLLQKSFWETASYPGMIGFVLALCALMSLAVRSPRASRLGRITIGAVCVMLLGCYLCSNGKLPGMGSFREPLKARAVIVLGLSIMTAVGAELLCMSLVSRGKKIREKYCVVFLVVSCCLLLCYGAFAMELHTGRGLVFVDWLLGEQEPYDMMSVASWRAAKSNPQLLIDMLLPATYRAAGFVLCGMLLMLLSWYFAHGAQRRHEQRLCLGLLLLIGAAEPYIIHLPLYRSQCPFDAADISAEMRSTFEPLIANARKQGEPLWRVAINRQLPNMSHHMEGLYETSGYDPIRPNGANTRQVLVGGFQQWEKDKSTAMALISSAIGQRYDCVDWAPNSGVPLKSVLKENNPLARLITLERNVVPGCLSDDNCGPTSSGLHFIVPPGMARSKSGDPVDEKFANTIRGIADGARNTTSDTLRVLNDGTTPNQCEVEVNLGSPAVLLYHTTWLPGWRVRIDGGKEVQPWFANNWMIGLPIDGGKHHICFIYRPQHFALSWMLGAVGVVLMLAIGNNAIRLSMPKPSPRNKKKSN